MSTSPSLQLYTLREAISQNLERTVAQASKIGFDKVEPYSFVERADEFERAFLAAGVSAPSGHAALIDSTDPARTFDAANQLGIGTVIDPFIPTDRWQTADHVKVLAERANALAEQAKAEGLRFGYHNHQWEFSNKIEGRSVFDLFVELTVPEVVLEIDIFWATVGGADVPALLKSFGERVAFLHVKDGKVGGDIVTNLPSRQSALVVPKVLAEAFKDQTPAGQGDIDLKAALAAAPHAMRVVEFDGYAHNLFDGIAESFKWLSENDR